MARFIVYKKSRHYTGGLGVDGKIHANEKLALEVAVEMTQRNPVGYEVLPYKPVPKDDLPSERAINNMRRWLEDNEPGYK